MLVRTVNRSGHTIELHVNDDMVETLQARVARGELVSVEVLGASPEGVIVDPTAQPRHSTPYP